MKTFCPYCRESLNPDEAITCPGCNTPHHHDCWQENGGCTVFGCSNAPGDEPKLKIPIIAPQALPIERTAVVPSWRVDTFKLLRVVVQDRQRLICDFLFAATIGIPAGSILGFLFGVISGFFTLITKGSLFEIIRHPAYGILYGQLFGIISSCLVVAICGPTFTQLFRKQARRAFIYIWRENTSTESE